MQSFTRDDLSQGVGFFEQAMRSQSISLGTAARMTPGVAVGVLSSAMRSEVPAAKLDEFIDREFAHSAALLKRVLTMYEGNDWDIHLCNRLPTGKYKLCTALCQPDLKGWRYDPSQAKSDW